MGRACRCTWTCGSRAAYLLLRKAGERFVLNELTKLRPIEQCQVAVTSGGRLPVHYVFHTAALKIYENETDKKVEYAVSKSTVCESMRSVLEKAAGLEVDALYVPLMGAGTGGF